MKTKNIAQPVTEPKQEAEIEPKGFDIEELKSKVPKAFHGYIEPVLEWANSVEQRFAIMEKTLPTETAKELERLMIERQREYVQKVQSGEAQNPVAGGGMGGIMQALPYFLQMLGGGGGGGNEQLQKLAMNALTSQINMSSAITNAVVAKITSKATSDVANEIV